VVPRDCLHRSGLSQYIDTAASNNNTGGSVRPTDPGGFFVSGKIGLPERLGLGSEFTNNTRVEHKRLPTAKVDTPCVDQFVSLDTRSGFIAM
jgi:hypothetical protein